MTDFDSDVFSRNNNILNKENYFSHLHGSLNISPFLFNFKKNRNLKRIIIKRQLARGKILPYKSFFKATHIGKSLWSKKFFYFWETVLKSLKHPNYFNINNKNQMHIKLKYNPYLFFSKIKLMRKRIFSIFEINHLIKIKGFFKYSNNSILLLFKHCEKIKNFLFYIGFINNFYEAFTFLKTNFVSLDNTRVLSSQQPILKHNKIIIKLNNLTWLNYLKFQINEYLAFSAENEYSKNSKNNQRHVHSSQKLMEYELNDELSLSKTQIQKKNFFNKNLFFPILYQKSWLNLTFIKLFDNNLLYTNYFLKRQINFIHWRSYEWDTKNLKKYTKFTKLKLKMF